MDSGQDHEQLPMAEQTEAAASTERHETRRRRFLWLGIVLIAIVITALVYWFATRGEVSTDDAFIDGDAVSIAAQIGGKVMALHFTDNQVVNRGDLLIEIDPRPYQAEELNARATLEAALAQVQTAEANLAITETTAGASLDQAQSEVARQHRLAQQSEAQIASARANSVRSAADEARARSLYASHVMSKQNLDQAVATAKADAADLEAAQRAGMAAEAAIRSAVAQMNQAETVPQQVALRKAQVAQAEAGADQARAQLQTAELNLSYTKVIAPQTGRIAGRNVNPGDTIQQNQMLARLVIGTPWVTANFKETQITDMHPGQPVTISVDAYPGTTFHGYVDSIQPASGTAFSLLPPENATGNYVKVVQRVPVKIVFDNPADIDRLLAIGLSVVPTVDTTAPAAAVLAHVEPPADLDGTGKIPDGGTAQ
jgi:membrane fusion protein (multidrug efflux system)